jgi:hypothetical protein
VAEQAVVYAFCGSLILLRNFVENLGKKIIIFSNVLHPVVADSQ